MPDKMCALGILDKRYHADRIDDAACKAHPEQHGSISKPVRNKYNGAPADKKIQCEMKRAQTSGTEYPDECHAGNYQEPLNAEEYYSLCIAPVDQIEGRRSTSDEEVDG